MNDSFMAAMNRKLEEMVAREKTLRKDLSDLIAVSPLAGFCDRHHVNLAYDDKSSWEASMRAKKAVLVPVVCKECAQEAAEATIQARLKSFGVPSDILHSRFDNWVPGNPSQVAVPEVCHEFATKVRRGFLILLGSYGTGKSHLAAACLRHFKTGVFTKQSTLLSDLRTTYRDNKAQNPIEKCKKAGLLVLDEMGVSAGGRDEFPMLHDILDYRYTEKKPTILTGNISRDEFKQILGERLNDRLTQATYKIYQLTGESHRARRKDDYFAV